MARLNPRTARWATRTGVPVYGRRHWITLAAITIAGGALRFATLDVQSFGQDELVTDWLVRMPFHSMLDTLPRTEATPPLYYLLAWPWARAVGFGEVGIRSLSASLGTLTVLVVGLLRVPRVSPRVPLAAAALVASSPLLIWYSQEARAYALLGLLAAASFVLTVKAIAGGGGRRTYVAWAVVAVPMVATHYFSVLLLAPEVFWMARAGHLRRASAVGVVALAAWLALLPLELVQRNRQFGGHGSGSIDNALRLPKQLLTGHDSPAEYLTAPAAALLVLLILAIAHRAPRPERTFVTVAAVTGAAATLGGVALAMLGVGFLSPRYFVGALVPCLAALAPGIAESKRGLAAGALLCLLGVGVTIAVASNPTYQRVDYRSAAKAIGPPRTARAIVVTPGTAFQIYLPGATNFTRRSLVGEIVVIGLAYQDAGIHQPPRARSVPVPAGFRPVQRVFARRYTLLRFRASRERHVSSSTLGRSRLVRDQNETILIQPITRGPTR